ncbi:MAG: ATP-binding protein [Promethearchaeota archaeon]
MISDSKGNNNRTNLFDSITLGTNLCYFYKEAQDCLEIVISFIKEGLQKEEQILIINAEQDRPEGLQNFIPGFKNVVKKGQFKQMYYKDIFFKKSGTFTSKKVPYSDNLKQALKKGFQGLRIVISMKWLKRKDIDTFVEFITSINGAISGLKIISLSLFPLTKFRKTDILGISNSYQRIIIKGNEEYEIIENIEDKRVENQLKEASVVSNGVAHDFNNMLTIIKGNAEMALSEIDSKDTKLHEHLIEIIESTNSARRLVQQLYNIYRKSSLHDEAIQPINLNKLIIKIIELVNLFFKQSKHSEIEIQLDLDAGLKDILVDPGKMEQILLNLIINAKDAMPEGGKIFITTEMVSKRRHPKQPEENLACLSIKDTGTGIPEELIHKIFFTTKGSKGTGFGLFLVKKIINDYNGWIKVESALGKGTTFKLYLPLE